MSPAACRFCGATTMIFGRATVLRRHEATYLRCTRCRSVHVAEPGWLDEAYSSAIASTDVGLASRSVWTSQFTRNVLRRYFPHATRGCDFGGGTGLFVRLMRDAGYDFVWDDRYATNEFASGFEARAGETFDLVTAFEVVEHLTEPAQTIGELLGRAPALLCTTLLLPEDTPPLDRWWYYCLETGQHISFATRAGIEHLAASHGVHVTSTPEVHLLAPRRVPRAELRMLTARRTAPLVSELARRRSLLPQDHERAMHTLR